MPFIHGLTGWALVLLALSAAYALPGWRLASRLTPGGWPPALLTAILLGTGSQALIGLLVSRLSPGAAAPGFILYFVLWLLANLALAFPMFKPNRSERPLPNMSESLWLAFILSAAVLVRSIHPFRHMALGQSDAYMHLTFLRDILEAGRLHNPIYPPGFSWILALPTWLFRLDPYDVCRFGGGFFGAAMVLAVFVLLRRHCGRGAALAASFLAACFPALYLLVKTGIGVFPNQYGILLLPVIFSFALRSGREGLSPRRAGFWLLAFSFVSLTATVPMMVPHALLVILLAGVFSLSTPGVPRPPLLVPVTVVLVPLLFFAALIFSRVGSRELFETLDNVIAGSAVGADYLEKAAAGEVERGLPSLRAYVADYLSVKRAGLGSAVMNGAAAALGIGFILTAAEGYRRRNACLRLVGTWGFLGVLHVSFGILQFTAYQREGWSLFVAVACLGGIVLSGIHVHLKALPGASRLPLVSAGVVLALALLFPPGNRLLNSAVEENIARFVRSVEREGVAGALRLSGSAAVEHKDSLEWCQGRRKWTIVARKFPQFGLIPSLLSRKGSVSAWEVTENTDLETLFAVNRCYAVLLDDPSVPDAYDLRSMTIVSPRLLQGFMEAQTRLQGANASLEKRLGGLEGAGWDVVKASHWEPLRVFLLTPPSASRP